MEKRKLRFDQQIVIMLEIAEIDNLKNSLKRNAERLENATVVEEIEESTISIRKTMEELKKNPMLESLHEKAEHILDLVHMLTRADVTRSDVADAIQELYTDMDHVVWGYEATLRTGSN